MLRQIAELDDIDDYQIEEFFTSIAESMPDVILALLMDRIERSEASGPRALAGRGMPFQWRGSLTPQGAVQKLQLLQTVWDWMARSPQSFLRQHDGARLWWLIAGGSGGDAMDFMASRFGGSAGDFQIMGNILKELPRDFTRNNVDFVDRALVAADREGKDSLRRIVDGLFGSIISGMRSRAIGVADPEDIEERDAFVRIAKQFSSNSPTRRFYESMAENAQLEIARHAHDDAALLDNKDWLGSGGR